jgi:hypothetical protein
MGKKLEKNKKQLIQDRRIKHLPNVKKQGKHEWTLAYKFQEFLLSLFVFPF